MSDLCSPAAVFWDMDGTLIDTEPKWGETTYALADLLGRSLPPEERERTVGASFEKTLSIVGDWAGYELKDGDVERYRAWTYAKMGELLAGGIELNPGIGGVLDSLRRRGTPMLVTTNTERPLADICIDAIGREYFADTITGDEVAHPKPAPDMYAEAAKRVGAAPADCIVFEDSVAGMSAARAAGCAVVGLAAPGAAVPAGVYVLDPANFVGATAADVDRWFTASAMLAKREDFR